MEDLERFGVTEESILERSRNGGQARPHARSSTAATGTAGGLDEWEGRE